MVSRMMNPRIMLTYDIFNGRLVVGKNLDFRFWLLVVDFYHSKIVVLRFPWSCNSHIIYKLCD